MSVIPSTRRIDPILQIAAAVAVCVLLIIIALRRIWCADFWWQYATGRLIAEQGIPHTDVFSFTAFGHRWIELRWIYCYLLYQLTTHLGCGAAVVLKCLVIAATFALALLSGARRGHLLSACIVVPVALLASSQRLFVRPELVTYFMLALYMWILQRYHCGRSRLLYALPLLQVVWTNTHTMFMLGPLMVGLLITVTLARRMLSRSSDAVERAAQANTLRRLIVVWALTVAACLVNPYGLEGFLHPLQLFSEMHTRIFKQTISELRSPFGFSQTYTALIYFEVLIVLTVVSCALNWTRLDPFLSILCLAQFYLAATSIRNLPLFAISAVALIMYNLGTSPQWHRLAAWGARTSVDRVIAVAVIVACFGYCWDLATDRFNIRQQDTNQFGIGLAQQRYPIRAVEFLKNHHIEGSVFASMQPAAYLLSEGYRVFIDPRLEVYGEPIIEQYIQMQAERDVFHQAVQHYGLALALVELQAGCVKFMREDRSWRLVYFDELVAVFVRGEPPAGMRPLDTSGDFERVAESLLQRVPAPQGSQSLGLFERACSPAPSLRIGKFLLAFDQPEAARPFLEIVVNTYPHMPGALTYYAALLQKLGDDQGAIKYYEQAVELEPANASLHFVLAQLDFSYQRYPQALALLQRCVKLEPDNALAWAMMCRIYLEDNDTAAAAVSISRAVQLEPSNPTYLKVRAKVHMLQREYSQAITILDRLIDRHAADQPLFVLAISAHLAQGDLVSAQRTAQLGLQRFPEDPELVNMLQQIRQRME